MKTIDNQPLSPCPPRLYHALSYAIIRALEMDMEKGANSLTINAFQSDSFENGGGGGGFSDGYHVHHPKYPPFPY